MLNLIYLCLVCLLFCSNSYVNGTDSGEKKITNYDKISVFTLKNGMKVILKKTDFDKQQVFIRLTAKGGLTSIPLQKLTATYISTQAALEVGFEGVTADKFYAEEIELSIELFPYCRRIDGLSSSDDFDKLLNYINQYFQRKTFTQMAFDNAKSQILKLSKFLKYDQEIAYQQAFLGLNTGNFGWIQSLNSEEIQKVDLKSSQEVFNCLFTDPAEFIVVIVGDFKSENILQQIDKYLGTLPNKASIFNPSNPQIPVFPKENKTKEILNLDQRDSLARLTFPLISMNFTLYPTVTILEEIVLKRISEKLKRLFNEDKGVEVFFEDLTYPRLELPLLVIQFRSELSQVRKVQSIILEEVKKLCEKGVTLDELNLLKKELSAKDAFWLNDNVFWLSSLSDHYIMHLPGENIIRTGGCISQANFDQVNKILKELLCKNNYSFLYSHP
jgi:zinc protease